MGNICGKKLLILGSSSRTIDIINQARKMGVYTIVADWNPVEKAPVKLAADEHWEISLLDYDAMSKKIKERGVNGIITGFTDSYLLPYQHLCEINNLPSYATKEVFETTLDKSKFKAFCRAHDVPVVPEYDLKTFDPSTISKDHQVFIKPVDNSGSRGIAKCDDPAKFQECLEYSLSFSKKKQVVIEKYFDWDSISMSYTIQDGEISLSSIDDRYVHKAAKAGATTCGSIYPSKYTDAYLEKVNDRVRKMYQSLGVKNGVLFIQGFTNGEEFYFYEMGYRLSGGRHYVFTEYENKTSSVEQLIHFSLTGKMADYCIAERDNPKFKDLCCRVNILGKSDCIEKIEGKEYLQSIPEVIDVAFLLKEGDMVGADGSMAQHIATVNMIVPNKQKFLTIIEDIGKNFRVLNKNGENLVIDLLT